MKIPAVGAHSSQCGTRRRRNSMIAANCRDQASASSPFAAAIESRSGIKPRPANSSHANACTHSDIVHFPNPSRNRPANANHSTVAMSTQLTSITMSMVRPSTASKVWFMR